MDEFKGNLQPPSFKRFQTFVLNCFAGSPTEKGDEENSYDYDDEDEEAAAGEGRFVALRSFFSSIFLLQIRVMLEL